MQRREDGHQRRGVPPLDGPPPHVGQEGVEDHAVQRRHLRVERPAELGQVPTRRAPRCGLAPQRRRRRGGDVHHPHRDRRLELQRQLVVGHEQIDEPLAQRPLVAGVGVVGEEGLGDVARARPAPVVEALGGERLEDAGAADALPIAPRRVGQPGLAHDLLDRQEVDQRVHAVPVHDLRRGVERVGDASLTVVRSCHRWLFALHHSVAGRDRNAAPRGPGPPERSAVGDSPVGAAGYDPVAPGPTTLGVPVKELVYHRMLLPQVERMADKVGFIDGEYRATFAQHIDRVGRLAHALAHQLGDPAGRPLRRAGAQQPPVPRAVARGLPRRRGHQPAEPAPRRARARVHPEELRHQGRLHRLPLRQRHRAGARGGRRRAGRAHR